MVVALCDASDPSVGEGACLPPLETSRAPILLSPRNCTSPKSLGQERHKVGWAVSCSFPISTPGTAASPCLEIFPPHCKKSGEKYVKPAICRYILRLRQQQRKGEKCFLLGRRFLEHESSERDLWGQCYQLPPLRNKATEARRDGVASSKPHSRLGTMLSYQPHCFSSVLWHVQDSELGEKLNFTSLNRCPYFDFHWDRQVSNIIPIFKWRNWVPGG